MGTVRGWGRNRKEVETSRTTLWLSIEVTGDWGKGDRRDLGLEHCAEAGVTNCHNLSSFKQKKFTLTLVKRLAGDQRGPSYLFHLWAPAVLNSHSLCSGCLWVILSSNKNSSHWI
jgi:hypothetical protein